MVIMIVEGGRKVHRGMLITLIKMGKKITNIINKY